ncbi:MAG: hypothetical protein HQM08_24150 [Candidatus Riflebacteria bacterium]|nr:hypothetical protein [Candidatus Riflebacteria bacterium]
METFKTMLPEYEEIARCYLSEPCEIGLYRVSVFTQALMKQGFGPDEIVHLHSQVILKVISSAPAAKKYEIILKLNELLYESMVHYSQNHSRTRDLFLKMQESEKKYRQFVEGTTNFIIKTNSYLNVLFCNSFFTNKISSKYQKNCNVSLEIFFDPADFRSFQKNLKSTWEAKQTAFSIEMPIMDDFNEKTHVLWNINLFGSETDSNNEIIMIGHDITSLKRQEKNLSHTEKDEVKTIF